MSTASQADVQAGEVVYASVVEEPSAALAVAAAPSAIIAGATPPEILERAGEIAAALKDLIEQKDLSLKVNGKQHVEIGGWQALGALAGALGGQALHGETVPGSMRWLPEHEAWEGTVEIKTGAGVVVGRADGMCSRRESKWKSSDDYALRSMAETRAESRAYRRALGWLVNIAGYSATPAEEIPSEQGEAKADQLPYGPPTSKDEIQAGSRALEELIGRDDAEGAWKDTRDAYGYMPKIVTDTYITLAMLLAHTPSPEGGQQSM